MTDDDIEADIARNQPNDAHMQRLADSQELLSASLRRDRWRTESLRRAYFQRRYGSAWRDVMKARQ